MKYHLLFARETAAGRWSLEFGDHDLSNVKAERDDYRKRDHCASNLRIVTVVNDRQSTCIAAIARINS